MNQYFSYLGLSLESLSLEKNLIIISSFIIWVIIVNIAFLVYIKAKQSVRD